MLSTVFGLLLNAFQWTTFNCISMNYDTTAICACACKVYLNIDNCMWDPSYIRDSFLFCILNDVALHIFYPQILKCTCLLE